MTYVLINLVNRWPASRIEELMPWACAATAKAERAQTRLSQTGAVAPL